MEKAKDPMLDLPGQRSLKVPRKCLLDSEAGIKPCEWGKGSLEKKVCMILWSWGRGRKRRL